MSMGTATGADAQNPAVVTAAPFGKPQSNLLSGGGPTGGDEPFVSFTDRMNQLAKETMLAPDPEPAGEAEEAPEAKAQPETKSPDKKEDKADRPKTGVEALLTEDEPEAEAEAEKPTEADPFETPKGLTKKAEAKWGELKAKAREYDNLTKKVGELEGKLSERVKLTDADPVKKELEQVKAEYAELRKRQDVFDVESSEAFIKEVRQPVEQAWKALQRMSADTGVEVERMAEAIREEDPTERRKAISDIMDELPEYDRQDFRDLVKKVHSIYDREAELRENAGAAAAELRKQEGKLSAEKKTQARAAEMRAVSDLIKQLEPIAKQFAGKNETPEQVLEALNNAAQETPWDELESGQKAYALTAAAALPKLQANYKAALKELAAAQKEIQAYHAAGPDTTHVQNNQGDDDSNPGLSFLDRIIPAHLRRG